MTKNQLTQNKKSISWLSSNNDRYVFKRNCVVMQTLIMLILSRISFLGISNDFTKEKKIEGVFFPKK